MMQAAFATAVLLVAGSSGVTQQFDLLCTGTGSTPEQPDVQRPVSRHSRIDLYGSAWCGGDCTSVAKIIRADRNQIVLIDTAASSSMVQTNMVVNRLSGRTGYNAVLGGKLISEDVNCTKEPFSGFPVPKF